MKQITSPIQAGYTLIEVVMTITLASILLGFITINLLHAQQATTVDAAVDRLVADIRQQQEKAMNGTAGQHTGVHVAGATYTLFSGASYDPSDPANYAITFGDGITLMASPSEEMVFRQRSGELSPAAETITVTNGDGSVQKRIRLNRLGVISSVE
jgi:prepilin-type N-terminal cleavage/methylation domain-containing protein